MPSLATNLTALKGVGPKTAEQFAAAGLYTIGDLITFLPRKHEDFSEVVTIVNITPGKRTIRARVESIDVKRVRRAMTVTTAVLDDGTGKLRAVWFNQPYRATQFKDDEEYYFSGEFEFRYNRYQLTNPSAERVSELPVSSDRIVPIYPAIRGLKSQLVRKVLTELKPVMTMLPDTLPESIVRAHDLVSYSDAILGLHFPSTTDDIARARERLGFEELFQLVLASQLNRQENARLHSPPIPFDQVAVKQFVADLPFRLTDAQRLAAWEIIKDMEQGVPMNRLLQGDVGSGKTVVAGIAALSAAQAGYQTALMAPTEILARQHAATLAGLLEPFGISVGLLVGAVKGKARQELYTRIRQGDAHVIVGTHALIQDAVNFARLGLVVIDEQHRFGVAQRQALLMKAEQRSGGSEADPTRAISEQPLHPEGSAFPASVSQDKLVVSDRPYTCGLMGGDGGEAAAPTRAATDNRQSSGYSAFPAEVGQGEWQLAVRPYTRGLMGGDGGEAEAPTRTGIEQRSGDDGREEGRGNEADPSRIASDNHDTDEHSALPAEVGQDRLVISDRPYARGVMGGDSGEAETLTRAASEQPSHPEGSAFPAERGQEDSNWRPRVPEGSDGREEGRGNEARHPDAPHFLAMTATPIPRSLQLTVFGELDISILNELPAHRKPIKTSIVSPTSAARAYQTIDQQIDHGRQAYVICGLIDDSPQNDKKSVEAEYKKLKNSIFGHRRIGLLHGRMKPAEKDRVMQDFKNKDYDILVSTTVVEVGVDVPNATVIMIENADQFGLAQLHQLRGRVGRSDQQSYCYLMMSDNRAPSRRLRELEKSNDGFYLAEVDLRLRGPGEIYGRAQHGELNLQIASLADTRLIKRAQTAAIDFVASGAPLAQYPHLAQAVGHYQRLTTLN